MPTIPNRELGQLRIKWQEAKKADATVKQKLAPALEKVKSLREQQEAISLDVVLEKAGAREKHEKYERELADAAKQLALFEKAAELAKKELAEAESAMHAGERKAFVGRILREYRAMIPKAEEYQKTCDLLDAQREALTQQSLKIVGLWPGVAPQHLKDLYIGITAWQRAQAHEAWRRSWPDHMRPGDALSGYHGPRPDRERFPSLSERVKAGMQMADDLLHGRRSEWKWPSGHALPPPPEEPSPAAVDPTPPPAPVAVVAEQSPAQTPPTEQATGNAAQLVDDPENPGKMKIVMPKFTRMADEDFAKTQEPPKGTKVNMAQAYAMSGIKPPKPR
jgi:hypothetical protein